jgi:hypothetical protein
MDTVMAEGMEAEEWLGVVILNSFIMQGYLTQDVACYTIVQLFFCAVSYCISYRSVDVWASGFRPPTSTFPPIKFIEMS